MKDGSPLVSVVLPAYNAQATLAESIQSVIDQTYTHWELIVINDGSTDQTENIIKSFEDERVKYYCNDGNKRLIYTLNRGFDLATGKYIARMDADDVCFPCRFEKQVAFLEKHQDVIVCGTFMEMFGAESGLCKYKTDDVSIKEAFLTHTCFGHPSVMINRDLWKNASVRYDSSFKNAEDLKLWLDLMPYGRFANIPEVLLKYRISETQCTNYGHDEMLRSTINCNGIFLRREIGNELYDKYKSKGLNLGLLREVRKESNNRHILIAMYMNMDRLDLIVFLFYIMSGDFLIDTSCFKRVVNRFLGRVPKNI